MYIPIYYIDTTKRPLRIRIDEHTKDVFNPSQKWTALTKHAWHQDHKWSLIAVNPHAVNQRVHTENLSVFIDYSVKILQKVYF